MRKLLVLLLMVGIGVGIWYFGFHKSVSGPVEAKQQPVVVSQHSGPFNTSINKLLDSYAALTEGFVNWDTIAINKQASVLLQNLGSVNYEELKRDTAIYQTASGYTDMFKNDLATMQTEPDITKKRQAFHSFSQNLYDLLRTVKYDGSTLYLQECPMAFNDTDPGLWVSRHEAIRNPYLGLHHPKYGKAMLECGSNKDSIHYTTTASY